MSWRSRTRSCGKAEAAFSAWRSTEDFRKDRDRLLLPFVPRSDAGLANKVIRAQFDGRSWRETRRAEWRRSPATASTTADASPSAPTGISMSRRGGRRSEDLPQNLDSLAGKVLRMSRRRRSSGGQSIQRLVCLFLRPSEPAGTRVERGRRVVRGRTRSVCPRRNQHRSARRQLRLARDLRRRKARWDGNATAQLGQRNLGPVGIAFSGPELLVAALQKRGLHVVDAAAGALELVFSSNERFRDVLPVGRDLYVITTNRSPRGDGPSSDRLLRLSPRRG